MTQFLGFKFYGEEYKLIGLAAYGVPKYFDKIKKNLFLENTNDFCVGGSIIGIEPPHHHDFLDIRLSVANPLFINQIN